MDVVECEWSLLSILNFLLNLLELLIKICLVEEWRVKTQKSSKKSKFEKQILGLKMKFKLKVDFSIEKTNLFFEKKTNSSRKSQNKPKSCFSKMTIFYFNKSSPSTPPLHLIYKYF